MNPRSCIYPALLTLIIAGCSTTGTLSDNDNQHVKSGVEKAQYYVNHGKEFMQRREFNNAKKFFLKAAEADPGDYKNWALAGQAAKDNSEFDEAILYTRKAIGLNPKDYRAYGNIGIISKRLNRYEDAISAFNVVLKLNSNDILSVSYLAEIYFETGDYVKCEQYIERFNDILSKKNTALLSDQTKKYIEKTLNTFDNYRSIINDKINNRQTGNSM